MSATRGGSGQVKHSVVSVGKTTGLGTLGDVKPKKKLSKYDSHKIKGRKGEFTRVITGDFFIEIIVRQARETYM